MIKHIVTLIITVLFFCNLALAQNKLVAYVYEANNRGLARNFELQLKRDGTVIDKKISDENGKVEFIIKNGENFVIHGEREGFYPFEQSVQLQNNETVTFIKIPVKRLPGYDFEVLISEKLDTISRKAESIENTTTLVLNNTNKTIETKVKNSKHDFSYKMLSGNHYSFLFSKEGYLTKRVEVNVNVNGCILCFTGLQLPQVAKTMTDDNKAGTISANMFLEALQFDFSKVIPNINFDKTTDELNNAAKVEADKFALFLQDNANINIALEYNNNVGFPMEMVEKRISNFRKYLIKKGVEDERISTSIIDKKAGEKSNYVSYKISSYNRNEPIAVNKDFKEKELPKIDLQNETITATASVEPKQQKPSIAEAVKNKSEEINEEEKVKNDEIKSLLENLKQEEQQKQEQTIAKAEEPKKQVIQETKNTVPVAVPTKKEPVQKQAELSVSQNVKYRVELMQLNIFLPVDAPIYKENPDVFTEKQKTKKVAYLTSSYPTENEAVQRVQKLQKQGYNDAKVIKYVDGKRVE